MQRTLLAPLFLIFLLWHALVLLIFEIFFHLFAIFFLASGKGRRDDLYRIHNWCFGRIAVRAWWPYVRTTTEGLENMPGVYPVVAVYNHLATIDVFYTTMVPAVNTCIAVRDWPFRKLYVLNWFMRLARYINAEKIPADELLTVTGELAARKVSFQFYPEGHRSRDGKLHRFHSGAFRVAFENNLPVVPVCFTGTDKIQSGKFPWLRPGKVKVKILPAVYPGEFTGSMAVLEMLKETKGRIEKELKNA